MPLIASLLISQQISCKMRLAIARTPLYSQNYIESYKGFTHNLRLMYNPL